MITPVVVATLSVRRSVAEASSGKSRRPRPSTSGWIRSTNSSMRPRRNRDWVSRPLPRIVRSVPAAPSSWRRRPPHRRGASVELNQAFAGGRTDESLLLRLASSSPVYVARIEENPRARSRREVDIDPAPTMSRSVRLRHDPNVWLGRLPTVGIDRLSLVVGDRSGDDHVVALLPVDRRRHAVLRGQLQ